MSTKNSLTITDNRTSKTYELPIVDGTVSTMGLRAIKTDEKDFGLMGYDPAFMNTASCRSSNAAGGNRMSVQSRTASVGQHAPDFTLTDQHGAAFTLSTALDVGPVVLVFLRGFS